MAKAASQILATHRITTKLMYKAYRKKNPNTLVTYNQFKKIVGDANREIIEGCLKGGTYNFGNLVGTLCVTKFNKEMYIDDEGNLKGLRPDYGATKKHKANGGTNVIYHESGLICRWTWKKFNTGRLKNKCMWSFVPTDGPKGISRKLHHYVEKGGASATMNYKLLEPKRKAVNG